MIEFNADQMSEKELIEAANDIYTAQEHDFERIKSEKWYHTLFHAITLNQDGKKYMVRGISSLAKLQKLFMEIYVKKYRKSYERLDSVIEMVTKNSEAIKKLYGMCVLNFEEQESLEALDSQDAEILALFLGEYRDANGMVPEKVKEYNRGVLCALGQKIPNGTLDNHQIRKLKMPKVVYRCFMEQSAVDGTIDTQEWSDKIYEDLKDFELSENSKDEIKESVKYEEEIAGTDYFIIKYTNNNSEVSNKDFEIVVESITDNDKMYSPILLNDVSIRLFEPAYKPRNLISNVSLYQSKNDSIEIDMKIIFKKKDKFDSLWISLLKGNKNEMGYSIDMEKIGFRLYGLEEYPGIFVCGSDSIYLKLRCCDLCCPKEKKYVPPIEANEWYTIEMEVLGPHTNTEACVVFKTI